MKYKVTLNQELAVMVNADTDVQAEEKALRIAYGASPTDSVSKGWPFVQKVEEQEPESEH